MTDLPGYDAWLEAPYQEAYAQAEYEEALTEEMQEEPFDCEHCESANVQPKDLRVTDVQPWKQGRFGGYTARVTWRCPNCDAEHRHDIEDDNIDL